MACFRFPAGSWLPFSGGFQMDGGVQPEIDAGQAPLPKAEVIRPHTKMSLTTRRPRRKMPVRSGGGFPLAAPFTSARWMSR